jgi:hypothetical protein
LGGRTAPARVLLQMERDVAEEVVKVRDEVERKVGRNEV